MNIEIWHNARCSTSRKVLDYLQSTKHNVQVRYYQALPPNIDELRIVLEKMKAKPEYILRKKEPIFIEKYKSKILSETAILELLIQHPILIERPIVISEENAWLARPFDEFIANIKIV